MQEILSLNKDESLLLIIDIQQRLAQSMAQDEFSAMLRKTKILIAGCDILEVPLWQSLQYVKGLGESAEGLFGESSHIDFEKRVFSVVYEGSPLLAHLAQNPHITQIIIAGMEAHICVLQSARDLLNMGFGVVVASDCVISRNSANKANALSFLASCGVSVLNTESILFDLLKDSRSPQFKAISALIK